MPLYMDIHNVEGASPEDIAEAHYKDEKVQSKHGVKYSKYWFNQSRGKVFCLCEAPSPEAAAKAHAEAHGLLAEKIIEVEPDVLEAFMGNAPINAAGAAIVHGGAEHDRDTGIRTVLFTDIVGSTSMTQQLGDEVAMMIIRAHDTIVRDALAALGGREVKHTGDGIMASFSSPASAVKAAARIQKGFAEHKNDAIPQPLRVRIGAAAGEPVERNNDLFGSTVQLAARLCAHAQPEQILVSSVIAELCIGKTLPFEDLGEVMLKGFDKSVRIHAVTWS